MLRINTSAGAARMILTPIILDYLKRYPDMQVTLVTEGGWSTSSGKVSTRASVSPRPCPRT
jgi:DNA-binding transcriptional LysR family regulator